MAASLAVFSPSTFSRYRAATPPEGYQPPGTCPLSVSRALRAFLRPGPAGLVSCRSRPWGSTLQGRSPLAEPCTLSDAVALMGLASLPGSVPTASAASGPGNPAAAVAVFLRRRRFRKPAPLQGVAPCEWPCHRGDCLGQPGDRDPRGFLLPGEFSLSVGDPPRGPSSRGLLPPVRRLGRRLPLRVFDRRRDRLDSFEPAIPSEVCHLLVRPSSLQVWRLWVTPRRPSAVTSRI